MNTKKSRSNKQQIKVTVDFMSTHNHLATGEFTGPLGGKRADSQWQVLRNILKEYGPDRSIEQWKQTWKDLKKNARHENAAAVRAQSSTGNTNYIPIVSEIGIKILDTIGHESSTGVGPEETLIGLPHDTVEIACNEPNMPSTSCILPTFDLPPPPLGFADQENIPPHTSTNNQTHTHPRARARAEPHAEVFARLQEESNTILKEIAASLKEKNVIMKEQNKIMQEQNSHLAEANRLKRAKRFSRRFSFT